MFKRNTIYREDMRRNHRKTLLLVNLCLGGGWLWRSRGATKLTMLFQLKLCMTLVQTLMTLVPTESYLSFLHETQCMGRETQQWGTGGATQPWAEGQHHLGDAVMPGRQWLPGLVFPPVLILAVKSAADTWAAGIEESARGRREGRAEAILSWLIKSVAEEKWPTLATPRKEVIWGRGDLMNSKRPALARKVVTLNISSHVFTLNHFISSASYATSFLEEFGFLIIPTVFLKKKIVTF